MTDWATISPPAMPGAAYRHAQGFAAQKGRVPMALSGPRRASAPLLLATLALLMPHAAGARSLPRPTHARTALVRAASVVVQRPAAVDESVRHTRVYGTITAMATSGNGATSTNPVLSVYSKTHRTTSVVALSNDTVVKVRTAVVARNQLHTGVYIIASCGRRSDGMLLALTIHIELNHGVHRRRGTHH